MNKNTNFNYINLSPFKWFVLENFPYIEADFDALTNWQLFCKLGKEMNKIIEKVNLAGQQTEDLTKAFNELKNYVDNYFKNLDVQEEINNKLDTLAENGTLYNIMRPYFTSVDTKLEQIENKVDSVASGSPLVASSIEEMTDTTRVYVNTTNGHWYYYNGTEWSDGGVYQAREDSDIVNILNLIKNTNIITEKLPVTIKNQQCINNNGQYIPISNTYCATEYDVTNLDIVFINAITDAPNKNYANILWKNDQNEVISFDSNRSYTFNNWVIIPKGASKLLLGTYTDSYKVSYVLKLNDLQPIIENIKNDIQIPIEISSQFNINNLFNKDTITPNKKIQGNGVLADNTNYFTTDFIPVNENKILYFRNGTNEYVVCYDEDKNFIPLGASTPYIAVTDGRGILNLSNIDNNIAYIRYSTYNSLIDKLIIKYDPIYEYNSHYTLPISNIENTSNYIFNFWKGKIGDSLGDSLTGQNGFQEYTKQYLNLAWFYNHGVGGTRMTGNYENAMWQDSRINQLNTNADFITVLGGQNDGNVEIGEISKNNFDINTYVGAVNTIIKKIYNHCGNSIKIILCTPFYVPAEGEFSERFNKLGEAIRQIGKIQGLPVADFGGLCGSNYYLSDIYWSDSDKTHPSLNFYKERIVPILINTLRNIEPIDYNNINSVNIPVAPK